MDTDHHRGPDRRHPSTETDGVGAHLYKHRSYVRNKGIATNKGITTTGWKLLATRVT